MNLGINGRARVILLGSVLLLLSLSSFTILRGLSSASPSTPVNRLMPTLNYNEFNGDSQVGATITLSNGCLHLTSWGTPAQSGNNFSATAQVTDYSGPEIVCTLAIITPQFTYSLGRLASGNYSFTLNACIAFPSYGGAIDCNSNKATIFFQPGSSNPKPPPTDPQIKLEYQEINGDAFVNATIIVPTCFRMRGWSDASQSGNSFRSNVTIVDDSRLMIACFAFDTLAFNSYDLGRLAPGMYSFTLTLCKVFIGWGTMNTNSSKIMDTMDTMTSTDCSSTRTIFFVVPGNPAPQPPPVRGWYMIFGPFAIIIMILLRLLRIPLG